VFRGKIGDGFGTFQRSSLLVPGLHDRLARDLAAFKFAQSETDHLHPIGISAGLTEGEAIVFCDARHGASSRGCRCRPFAFKGVEGENFGVPDKS
jgi:nucleoid-associated protein YejK